MNNGQPSSQSHIDADNTANYRIAQNAYEQQRQLERHIADTLSDSSFTEASLHAGSLVLEKEVLLTGGYIDAINADTAAEQLTAANRMAVSAETGEITPSPEYIAAAALNLASTRKYVLSQEDFTLAA